MLGPSQARGIHGSETGTSLSTVTSFTGTRGCSVAGWAAVALLPAALPACNPGRTARSRPTLRAT